jgi:opacity protein-like surface antigen
VLGALAWTVGAGAAAAQPQLPDPAPAQPPTLYSWEITPFFGAAFGDDFKTTTTLGFGAAYRANAELAFEGELGYLPDLSGEDSSVDASVLSVAVSGLYIFQLAGLEPYGALGIGFSRFTTEVSTGESEVDESHTEFAFNLGGGVRRQIGTRTSVRGDVRYFNVNDENPNFWRVYGGVTFHLGG